MRLCRPAARQEEIRADLVSAAIWLVVPRFGARARVRRILAPRCEEMSAGKISTAFLGFAPLRIHLPAEIESKALASQPKKAENHHQQADSASRARQGVADLTGLNRLEFCGPAAALPLRWLFSWRRRERDSAVPSWDWRRYGE